MPKSLTSSAEFRLLKVAFDHVFSNDFIQAENILKKILDPDKHIPEVISSPVGEPIAAAQNSATNLADSSTTISSLEKEASCLQHGVIIVDGTNSTIENELGTPSILSEEPTEASSIYLNFDIKPLAAMILAMIPFFSGIVTFSPKDFDLAIARLKEAARLVHAQDRSERRSSLNMSPDDLQRLELENEDFKEARLYEPFIDLFMALGMLLHPTKSAPAAGLYKMGTVNMAIHTLEIASPRPKKVISVEEVRFRQHIKTIQGSIIFLTRGIFILFASFLPDAIVNLFNLVTQKTDFQLFREDAIAHLQHCFSLKSSPFAGFSGLILVFYFVYVKAVISKKHTEVDSLICDEIFDYARKEYGGRSFLFSIIEADYTAAKRRSTDAYHISSRVAEFYAQKLEAYTDSKVLIDGFEHIVIVDELSEAQLKRGRSYIPYLWRLYYQMAIYELINFNFTKAARLFEKCSSLRKDYSDIVTNDSIFVSGYAAVCYFLSGEISANVDRDSMFELEEAETSSSPVHHMNKVNLEGSRFPFCQQDTGSLGSMRSVLSVPNFALEVAQHQQQNKRNKSKSVGTPAHSLGINIASPHVIPPDNNPDQGNFFLFDEEEEENEGTQIDGNADNDRDNANFHQVDGHGDHDPASKLHDFGDSETLSKHTAEQPVPESDDYHDTFDHDFHEADPMNSLSHHENDANNMNASSTNAAHLQYSIQAADDLLNYDFEYYNDYVDPTFAAAKSEEMLALLIDESPGTISAKRDAVAAAQGLKRFTHDVRSGLSIFGSLHDIYSYGPGNVLNALAAGLSTFNMASFLSGMYDSPERNSWALRIYKSYQENAQSQDDNNIHDSASNVQAEIQMPIPEGEIENIMLSDDRDIDQQTMGGQSKFSYSSYNFRNSAQEVQSDRNVLNALGNHLVSRIVEQESQSNLSTARSQNQQHIRASYSTISDLGRRQAAYPPSVTRTPSFTSGLLGERDVQSVIGSISTTRNLSSNNIIGPINNQIIMDTERNIWPLLDVIEIMVLQLDCCKYLSALQAKHLIFILFQENKVREMHHLVSANQQLKICAFTSCILFYQTKLVEGLKWASKGIEIFDKKKRTKKMSISTLLLLKYFKCLNLYHLRDILQAQSYMDKINELRGSMLVSDYANASNNGTRTRRSSLSGTKSFQMLKSSVRRYFPAGDWLYQTVNVKIDSLQTLIEKKVESRYNTVVIPNGGSDFVEIELKDIKQDMPMEFIWNWKCENYDISCSIIYRPACSVPNQIPVVGDIGTEHSIAAEPEAPHIVVLERIRRELTENGATIFGRYYPKGPGTLRIEWDNRFSIFTSKKIIYNVELLALQSI